MAKKSLLHTYNKKRDFKVTKEPSGHGKVKAKKKGLTFVVQEHHASHLHYDFRLELEGVLKSWAVPKGPSLDPKDKRLAVQTEDHPLAYGKFHGTIPKGEYGGGEVFIWDNGTWEPKEGIDPVEALKKGRLEFSVKGKKLHGNFVLIRTHWKGRADGKNWLLIKMQSDEKLSMNHPKTKKVKKKLVKSDENWPGFIKPELPRLVTDVPIGKSWIHEMKYDGYRMQGHIQNGLVHFFTRSGLDWSQNFPFILNALGKLKVENAIFDGEVVAFDKKGHTNFQALQNSIKAKEDKQLSYYIFDILYLNGEDLRHLPLIERKTILKKTLKGASKVLKYSEHLLKDGKSFYEVSCEHGLEGIVSKMADSEYTSGRNDYWVKTKCSARQEFVIGGWTEPRGSRVGIGAILVGVYEKGKLKYAGKVGTGFDHATLKTLLKDFKKIEQDNSPFDIKSPRGKDIHWLSPEKVCEVNFTEWTEDGALRHPVFMGIREDKKPAVIHKEVKNVTLSSPDKILFKKDKKTKLDVAHFYEAISKQMLPYLKDRPLSLVRCPNGGDEHCFYQKHVTGHVPDSFHTLEIKEEKGKGTYITIDSVEGLDQLVQMNAFEIHAWNSHKDYKTPDQIVMDFDPGPGVPWKKVVEGAFELREILNDLGLKSFVKLTGGKGVHVHIPVLPVYDWDQIKSFSQTLAMELVSRKPELYVANMSKALRKNKIFIDYLRNGYGSTAVVPYSLRAKARSSVALPLTWEELKRVKAPDQYDMDSALKKIKTRKSDPWRGMLKLKQKIDILKPKKTA